MEQSDRLLYTAERRARELYDKGCALSFDPRAQSEGGHLGNGGDEYGDERPDYMVLNRETLQRPKNYHVLLHNDDYTTMDFVVMVLQKVFRKALPEAQKITMQVHKRGYGVCGTYSYEIAETKAMQVTQYAKEYKHPLKCTIEPAEDDD